MPITQYLLIAGCAYVIGYLAAIPVGATQLEIARRALKGRFRAALMVMAGSVTSDISYGLIGFFGLAPFLQERWVIASFLSVGSVISIVLGIWIIRTSDRHAKSGLQTDDVSGRDGMSYVTGFSLAFTNPLMIAWWLIGAKFLGELHVSAMTTAGESIAFLAGGALGIASYHVTLATVVRRAHRFLTEETIRKVTVIFGAALIGIGIYLLVRFVLIVQANG